MLFISFNEHQVDVLIYVDECQKTHDVLEVNVLFLKYDVDQYVHRLFDEMHRELIKGRIDNVEY
jgi:hypothetical protein